MYEALSTLFSDFLTPEVIITAVLLFLLGLYLKRNKKFNDNKIPITLILAGTIINGILSINELTQWFVNDIDTEFAIHLVQYVLVYSLGRGFISMALSVAIHQLLKQGGFFKHISKVKDNNITDDEINGTNKKVKYNTDIDNISRIKSQLKK